MREKLSRSLGNMIHCRLILKSTTLLQYCGKLSERLEIKHNYVVKVVPNISKQATDWFHSLYQAQSKHAMAGSEVAEQTVVCTSDSLYISSYLDCRVSCTNTILFCLHVTEIRR